MKAFSCRKNLIAVLSASVVAYILSNIIVLPGILSLLVPLLFFCVYAMLPAKFSLYNVFAMIPFMTMFDAIGIPYTFNICMLISFTKDIIRYHNIKKGPIACLICLTLLEVITIGLYGALDYSIISFFSLIAAFLYLVISVERIEQIKYENVYRSLFWGLIVSVVLSFITIYISSGSINFANMRFSGLFRDPNYYSFFIILLAFSLYKVGNKKRNVFVFILLILLGLLSTSKMFLLVASAGIILKVVGIFIKQVLFKMNIKKMLVICLAVLVAIFAIGRISETGIFETIYGNYLNRFEYQELTTGRSDLMSMYVNALEINPTFLLIGASNTYYNYVITDYMRGQNWSVPYYSTAHNTYLDIILSWGIIGTVIFIIFMAYIIKTIRRSNTVQFSFNYDLLTFILCIFACFFSLSFLSGDCFAFVILFILLLASRKKIEREK